MDITDIRKLYAYSDWANDRILGSIEALSEEQFARQVVSSYPSIRETLSHLVFADWLWLQRWMGESPQEYPAWSKELSFTAQRDQWHTIAADRRAYLSTLADDALGTSFSYRSIKGDPFTMPLGETLVHCANHATHHRGQLVTMLRQVGGTPPATMDYTAFCRETKTAG